ncbi:serine/threonine-protein kinase NEK6 [Acrasis kona]|uniref:Serine/threonine-protein kinase NEK6 n=1 Tax=Acrasis kona TaxID=1008807 RepID=A0AAW2Z0H5_9EUKA
MDYCSGGSMESVLTKIYKNNQEQERLIILSDDLKIKWVRQISGVLQYLKEKNIIHRDIKPDNILFHTDNENYDHIEDYNVRVCDFGFTKDLAGESSTNTFVGTPVYMPPEILARGKYDHSADIWSLGVSIVQLLIQVDKNHVPDLRKEIHQDSSYINNMCGKLNANITKNVSWNPTLTRLASTCCRLDPKNRPTPQDLLRIIDQYESEQKTPSSPTTDDRPISLSNRTKNPFFNLMTLNFGRSSANIGSTGTPKVGTPTKKTNQPPGTPPSAKKPFCVVS